jgi:16S rRNA processing protein RimM
LKTPNAQQDWVLVARIVRPRGNKGEVLAELFTDFSARFGSLRQMYLRSGSGEPRPAVLENFWAERHHPERGIFHFAGCFSISDAEKLRGLEIVIPFADRVELPAGHYFVSELIGCTVFEIPEQASQLASPACAIEEAPRVLGTVRDVFFPGAGTAGTPLLELETTAGELLLPLAVDICRSIDVAARRIDVTLPEGLRDLNAGE